jgi:hypothetical protein
LFELQQLLRQTDGTRFVVSKTAIFDFDFQAHLTARSVRFAKGCVKFTTPGCLADPHLYT